MGAPISGCLRDSSGARPCPPAPAAGPRVRVGCVYTQGNIRELSCPALEGPSLWMGAPVGYEELNWSVSSPLQHVQQPLDGWLQSRHVALRSVPNNIRIDLKIAVDEHVTHADDLEPRDIRRERSHFLWHRPRGLADNLKMAQEPGLEELISLEGGLIAISVSLDGGDGVQHVTQVPGGISHTGTASRRTRFRMRDFNPRTVTTSTRQPRRDSSSYWRPPRSSSDRPESSSTRKSMSLRSSASPRASDPNTRTALGGRLDGDASTQPCSLCAT